MWQASIDKTEFCYSLHVCCNSDLLLLYGRGAHGAREYVFGVDVTPQPQRARAGGRGAVLHLADQQVVREHGPIRRAADYAEFRLE